MSFKKSIWSGVRWSHDDVMTWKHFLYYCPIVRGTTGHKWIPLMRGQLFRVVKFVDCYSKQAVKQTVKFQWFVKSWYSCDVTLMHTLLCLIGGWWYVNAWLDCINIDAGYGLAPVLCQAFAWHNFDLLSIETSKTTCKMQIKNIFKRFWIAIMQNTKSLFQTSVC